MTILLDGEFLSGFDHRITANGQIDRKDLSGQNSSAAGGTRGGAWMLQVRLKIKMEDAEDLLALRAMFQADGFTEPTTDDGGRLPLIQPPLRAKSAPPGRGRHRWGWVARRACPR